MGRKKKHGSGHEDDLGEESDEEETLMIKVSLTPYGSKLKKPTDFFKSAFANIAKPYVKRFDIKSVSYLKDNVFLVRTSMKYVDVIQQIATRNDLKHAEKKIKIVTFSKAASSEGRKDSNRLFSTQSALAGNNELEKELECGIQDHGEELGEEETLAMQVLCTPNGSKLNKPVDFFNSAFASISKPYGTTLDVKSVASVKDDIFLIRTSMKYIDIIEKIAKHNDLEFAGKKLDIIAISNSASSKSRRDSSTLHLKQSESLMEKELKASASSSNYHEHITTEYKESAISDSKTGRVVEICGETDGLGDLCKMYFERSGGLDSFDIESFDLSARPQTITFMSSHGARQLIDNGKIDFGRGKQVYFKVFEKEHTMDQSVAEAYNVGDAKGVTRKSLHDMEDKQAFGMTSVQRRSNEKREFFPPGSIVEHGNKVEIYGNVGDVGKDTLVMYLESEKRSGGGDIKEANLEGNPPSVVFDDPGAAMRVVERGMHMFNGMEFHFKFPVAVKQKLNNEEVGGSCKISSEDCDNVVEIHGDIRSLGKESLEMYLENTKRSGGGVVKEMNFDANPPWVAFLESEAKERVVEKGVHTFDGKEFHFKVPVLKTEEKERDCSSSNEFNSSSSKNIVEIHGDITGLGKDSLEMYLESRKRSGGGEIREMNLDANPPWVEFRESEAKERVVKKGVHSVDGKEFHLKVPVLKKEEREKDNIAPSMSNSGSKNILEIHGDITGIGKESLEMYLESRKRSGGGAIKDMNMDAIPPWVEFHESEARERATERSVHTIDGKEFHLKVPVLKKEEKEEDTKSLNMFNSDCQNIVEIHGNIEELGKDFLEMYLESKKRSGGGEIQEMKFDASPPSVVFCDNEVAKRVVEKGVHMLDGKEFSVKFPVGKKEKNLNEEKDDIGRREGNIVEIHGDITGLGKDSLEMYLENEKRSGGGEIKELNMDAKPPWVEFLESEAKERVVKRGVHSVDGKEFHLEVPVLKKEEREKDSISPNTSNSGSKNVVEIHGDITGIGKESLEMYLENTKRSGGGEIKDMNMGANPPWVEFHESEAATRLVKKGEHTLSDVKFQLKRPIRISYRDDVIILRNVTPNTSNDLLMMYIDKLCGSSPDKIEYNHDKSVVMATIPCEIDWIRVTEAHSKRPTVDGAKIAIEKVPVCTSAVISNVPETVSTDHLQLLIEKYCGNDSIAGLDYVKGQQFASIRFHSPNALRNLLTQKITIEGKNVDIEEYSPSFITERISKIMKKEPAEICIIVDGLVMEHVMKNHKADLCRSVGSEVYTKRTTSKDDGIKVQACFSRRPDIPNQSEIFQSYYSEFIRKEASVDVKDKSVSDLADSLSVTVHVDPLGTKAVVIGRKPDVEKFLDTTDKDSYIQAEIELPPEKIKLLKSTGCLEELEKILSLKIETGPEKIRVVGPEPKIARLESKLNLKMQNITSSSEKVTDSVWRYLQNQKIFLKISSLMETHKVIFTVSQINKTINVHGMSQKDLSKGIERFKQIVVEEQVPLNESEASFIMGKKGSQLVDELLSSRNFILLDRSQNSFKFTGLANECFAAKEQLAKVLKENAFLTKFIPFSLGKTKAVLTICKERIDNLLQKSGNQQVSVNKSEDNCSIKVTGYGQVVCNIAEQIEAVSKVIKREDLVFQRPGLSKVIELDSSKHIISSLEKDKNVVIIQKDQDREGTIPREEIEREYDIVTDLGSSTLICTYQRSGDVGLSVYKGDITMHKADIIVNPANSRLWLGGGVAGAILSAGGNSIQDECDRYVREYGNLCDGEVITTGAGKLSCKKIIHAVGPSWPRDTREIGEQELSQNRKMSIEALTEVMVNVLEEAEKEECHVLAVPAISSGVFGFPKDRCAEILITVARDRLQASKFHNLREVHFVNNDDPTVKEFSEKFTTYFGKKPGFICFMSKNNLRKRPVKSVRKKAIDFAAKKDEGMQQRNSDFMPNLDKEVAKSSSPNGITMELVVGDLGKVAADVIVNSTSSNLNLSKNPCAHALSNAAGRSLQAECTAWVEANGQLSAYSFVETDSGSLKCRKVLHAVCGQYNGQDSENKLEKLVLELFAKANSIGSKSIAIPGLGTGQLRFPKNIVAKIMVDCVRKFSQNTSLEKVMLVAFDKDADMIAEFRAALQNAGSASASTGQPKSRRAPSFGSSLQNEEELFFKLGDVEMEIKCGDITKESVDAIVVLGNERINLLGAVGNAINEAEGEKFKKLLKVKAPQDRGTTKLIKTSKLPSKFLAHIVPASESYEGLKSATQGMFEKCNSKKLKSVSLPAIGTGVMGKSPEESAKLILHSFVELSIDNKVSNIKKVNIVLFEERLVSAFKRSLKELAKNPQKSLGERVITWIRDHVNMFVKSLFSRNGDEEVVADSNSHVRKASRDSPLTPVVFTVYFSHDKRVVNEIRERMMKVLDDHITSSDVQKEAFKNLPLYNFEKIRSFARKLDVLVELDTNAGKIKLSGYHRDLASVTEYCHEVATQKFEDDQRREKEQTVAKYVQWKEKQEDGSLCDYDPVLNYQIETQYKEMNSDPQIDIAEGEAIFTYKLDFSNMKITRKDGKEEKVLIREELASSASKDSINLPTNWSPMPKDGSGYEVKVHCVQLQPNSQEYRDVSAKFASTSGGQIHNGNIVAIERIQNPQLYKSYLAKKESMEKTAGQASVNELELFHGTNRNSVAEINENGFNRSFAGVNGTVHGVGVYFAKNSSYSVRYAQKSGVALGLYGAYAQNSGLGSRCMYLAKILAGKYTVGNQSYKVAPKGFDTVVDNQNSPTIHVVFYDNQCYPEYLLHFT